MRWMRRWLLGIDDAPVDPEYPTFKDEELQCTASGQVLADLKGKSVFDLNIEREKELAARRAPLDRAALSKKIGLRSPAPAKEVAPAGYLRRAGYEVGKGVMTTEPGVRLPYLLLTAGKPGATPLLAISGQGKAAGAAAGGPLEKAVQAGHNVIALDLRGWGETAPEGKSPFGADWKEAFLGLHLDRPLLGQRVDDVLMIVGGKDEFHLTASGAAVPVGLHAAALQTRIKELTVEGGILSWSAVVRARISQNQLSNVVPGALALYDLPDLAALIAPRRLTIKSPVDPSGRPVSQAELEEAYASARAAYKAAGAESNLVLQAER